MTPHAAVLAVVVVVLWAATVTAGAQTDRPVAADAFFKPDDVVALVGGEDVVVMRDQPALELLVLQQPGLGGIRFRILAFEGDTVFEQFRDLNFPSWEDQLKAIGATVVMTQFGKMESFAGPEGVPAFAAAYEQLLIRLAGGTRRVLVVSAHPPRGASPESISPYNAASHDLARRRGWAVVDLAAQPLHAAAVASLGLAPRNVAGPDLAALVRRKNMLWFHYWRPQNWAFLHGDRTDQASSRDHRDPTKRWFPEEMLQWLPLVAAREAEIRDTLDSTRKP